VMMYTKSKCVNFRCKEDHGSSANDSATDCPYMRMVDYCPYLWTKEGCGFYHGRKNG
jgi:hypothetical protein